MQQNLREAYALLDQIYRKYLDLNPKYYSRLCCWTLSALYHNTFPSFPFLFLNAMKGSGKSRLLKLNAVLLDGMFTTSLTPAVLFRTKGPLMLDEVETISSKEKNDLRELLNNGYKKGMKVYRAKKIEKTGETVVDPFDSYRAIMLANINGIDDVLEDRCIKLTLEKSFNKDITRRMELFEFDPLIKKWQGLKKKLVGEAVEWKEDGSLVSLVSEGVDISGVGVYTDVITLVFKYYNDITLVPTLPTLPTPTTPTTLSIYTTITTPNDTSILFSENEKVATKIYQAIEKTTITGRDLELWYPLFITAALISDDLLNEMVESAEEVSAERASTNVSENNDIVLIGFLHEFLRDQIEGSYITLANIVNQYHLHAPNEDKWFNSGWLARALERNKLVLKKRRLRGGREVILDFKKVAEKARLFGIEDEENTIKKVI